MPKDITDIEVAKKYYSKYHNAKERGVEFSLSLCSVKNMMKAEKCYFTGVKLTKRNISIDRVDNSKGYVKGNVVACSNLFNTLKGGIEDNTNDFNLDNIRKGLNRWAKRMDK